MEEKNSLKSSLSARVDPEIKENIFKEAEEKGMTPSHYVETILANRVSHNTENIEELQEEIVMTPPEPVNAYLGCKHNASEKTLVNGKTVRDLEYDMSDFLQSCCDHYEELAGRQ